MRDLVNLAMLFRVIVWWEVTAAAKIKRCWVLRLRLRLGLRLLLWWFDISRRRSRVTHLSSEVRLRVMVRFEGGGLGRRCAERGIHS